MLQAVGYIYERDEEAARDFMSVLFEEDTEERIRAGERAVIEMGYTDRGLDYLYQESRSRIVSDVTVAAEILLAAAGFVLLFQMKRRADADFETQRELERVREKMEAREQGYAEKEKMTQNFIENVAHQIKTPLSCITISLDRLMETAQTDKECHALAGQGLYYAGEIEKLLKRLLDIGRLEAGRVIWHRETFRFADMLADCAEDLAQYTGIAEWEGEDASAGNGITVGRVWITGDLDAEYYGDYEWVKEAFANLLKNSLEHDGSGGKIEAGVTWSKEGVKVSVRDRGPGFAEEDLPHIFDRFYLPDRIKKSHVGIGLNLAELVVREHFGNISARNREGGGAEFTVLLPVHNLKAERI